MALEGKTIYPIHDNILVIADVAAEKVGSIFLPERSQKTPQWGKAVAVGNQVRNVQEGDRVFALQHGGLRLIVAGVSYLIYKEREVLGKESEEAAA